ncbi:hypothetical protein MJH12_08995 [bacterium]|nr:hypothetical protein [bacterium]
MSFVKVFKLSSPIFGVFALLLSYQILKGQIVFKSHQYQLQSQIASE